jgi:fatty-acyl-CoA synthase
MYLHDFLDYWARERPDAEFAQHGERRLTYRQAQTAAQRLAAALTGAGLRRGDRLAVLAKNCLEYPLLYFAASQAGVVPVPLNYRAGPAEWAYTVDDAGARLLIAAPAYVEAVDALRAQGHLETVRRLLTLGEAAPPAGWESLRLLAATASEAPPPAAEGPGETRRDPEDDLYQLYTSGTTGQPKGAVLSQRAVVSNLLQIGATPHRGAPGERCLVVGPMLHAGVVWAALAPLSWGAALHIVEDFDPAEVVRILSEEQIGYAALVPTVLHACLTAVPDVAARAYPALRLIHTGAAPIAESTLLGARAAFGCDVVQGYGLTEGTAGLTAMAPQDYARAQTDRPDRLRAAGRPLLGTELRIVDAGGRPLPAGALGEVVARGPQLMRGYWKRPAATAEVLRGGWLHTGDVGRLDAEGYLFIQDRLKDVIVTGGTNVYPRMVERVLLEHPDVADVAVVGAPDAHWGERVTAVVVLRPGQGGDAAALIAFCHARLGGFQCPRAVDFVDALPRTTSGKVLKRALREAYWSGQERRVGAA